MLFDARITWIPQSMLDAHPDIADRLARNATWVQVSAQDEDEAEVIIRQEFAGQLQGFTEVPVVVFEKIDITPAESNLMLLRGYGT